MLIERDDIINHTIDAFEGGDKYTNRSADRGGPTKFGVTKKVLQNFRMHAIVDQDVVNLTRPEAVEIYVKDFWEPICGDQLPSCLRCLVFDMAVNHGVGNAGRILQWGLKNMRFYQNRPDGLIGPQTLACAQHAVSVMGPKVVLTEIVAQRKDFYENIVHLDPSQVANEAGWINRANWFLQHIDQIIPV